jgi:hypothetical protein
VPDFLLKEWGEGQGEMRVDLVYQTHGLLRDKMVRRKSFKTKKAAGEYFKEINRGDIIKAWLTYFDGWHDVFIGYIKNEGVI